MNYLQGTHVKNSTLRSAAKEKRMFIELRGITITSVIIVHFTLDKPTTVALISSDQL